jgi:hypothetical protein
VNREPRVRFILGIAHFDGELELVAERRPAAKGLAGVAVGVLALPQELGERIELFPELVELGGGLELAFVGTALAEDVLSLFRARPEIGRRRFFFQTFERAPRGVQIKDSPEATKAAPRRPSGRK